MEHIKPVTSDLPKVSEFYKDKTIFLTGGSGFLGQSLIEKLFWSFPDIKRIYVLIRSKRNKTIQERLDKLFKSDCFSRLRTRGDNFKEKVYPITGDLISPNLGISSDDRNILTSEVNIVIHAAANVKFDEPITSEIDSNVMGTKYLLDLALEIPGLEVFQYVSTAYCNCNLRKSEEKMYDPPIEWTDLIKMREKIDPSIFVTLQPKLLGLKQFPNTYVFTKNVAEHLVYDYGDKLPIVISRPTIVCGALKEPFKGWVDSLTCGPVLLSIGFSSGLLRVVRAAAEAKIDLISCDVVTNALIYSTYLRKYQKTEAKPIYNISASEHQENCTKLRNNLKKICFDHPMKYCIWNPGTIFATRPSIFFIYFLILQMIPALFFDLILFLSRKKTMAIKAERMIHRVNVTLCHFLENSFEFDNKNMHYMSTFMKEDEAKSLQFSYDKRIINLIYYDAMANQTEYIIRKYIKQKPEEDAFAKKLSTFLYALDILAKAAIYGYILWYIYSRSLIQIVLINTYEFITRF